jgi:hypothetical protein
LQRVVPRLAERGGDRERVEVDTERGAAELGVVPAAEPGCDLHHHRPVRAEPHLRVRRPLADPDRLDRRPRDLDRGAWITGRGPDVGERDSEGGRIRGEPIRDRERHKIAVGRERVHRDLGPLDVLLDEDAAAAGLRRRRPDCRGEVRAARDERKAALALPVRRLDDARERRHVVRREVARVRDTGCGERLALAELRRRGGGDARIDGMPDPHPRREARGDADRPVRAGRHDPVDVTGTGEPLHTVLVLRREHRALVREREADRLRVPVDGDHLEVAACPRGLEQPELGRACA